MVPPDCDLRDFPFMPLHVARFRDSDLVAERSLEEVGAATLLWSAAWHQVPAASLPDSDAVLARIVGRDVAKFRRIKAGALHGYVLCSDGRLYHPLSAREAKTAWQSKLEQRWKTECARIKKLNQRHNTAFPFPTFEHFLSADYVKPTVHVPGDSIGTHAGHDRDGVIQETETGTPVVEESRQIDPSKIIPLRAEASA
jgi:uncharacterized protein YdaU (DUF1376 family)